MNDHTRVRWERSLDGLDWERERRREKNKEKQRGKEGKEWKKKEFFYENIKVQFFIWKILIFFSTYLSKKKKKNLVLINKIIVLKN